MLLPIHILIDEALWPAMDTVAARLAAKGFLLERRLVAIGVLAGSAAAEDLDSLRAEPGVQGLEIVRDDFSAS